VHVTESGTGTEAIEDPVVQSPVERSVESGTDRQTGSSEVRAPADEPAGSAVEPSGPGAEPAPSGRRGGSPAAAGSGDEASVLDREGDVAADYLEELLDIADLDGDIDIDVDGDRAVVSLVGGDLRHLVGTDGAVVMALQDLTRLAVTRETGERSRLVVDVDGYRDRRRAEITVIATAAVELVRGGAERAPLPAMSAFERKIAHDVVADLGLSSDSEGEDPGRHVVVSAS